MSKTATFSLTAIALACSVLVSCNRQNPRTISHIDTDASIRSNLPWRPENGRVITVWVDLKNSSMSTLYGNGIAVASARSSADVPAYPAGTMLALVTWRQREDERWFGANIPAEVRSVEFVTVKKGPADNVEYVYQRFEGPLLQPTATEDSAARSARVHYLLSQHAAIMP